MSALIRRSEKLLLITRPPKHWHYTSHTPSKGELIYRVIPGDDWQSIAISSILYYLCSANEKEIRLSVVREEFSRVSSYIEFNAKISFFSFGRQSSYTLLREIYFVDKRKTVCVKEVYEDMFYDIFKLNLGEKFKLPLGKWGYIFITKLSEFSGGNNG